MQQEGQKIIEFCENPDYSMSVSYTHLDKIREELADVLNYCILMADVCGLDMDEIVQEKIEHNNAKYPVEKAKDIAKKYDEL